MEEQAIITEQEVIQEPEVLESVPTQPTKVNVESYEYSDLTMICKCGKHMVFDKGIPENNAVQLLITGRSDSSVKLTCESCGASIELRMLPSPEEDMIAYRERDRIIKESTENESIQEAGQEVQVDMGISDSDQPIAETNI